MPVNQKYLNIHLLSQKPVIILYLMSQLVTSPVEGRHKLTSAGQPVGYLQFRIYCCEVRVASCKYSFALWLIVCKTT
jgi:hypothetical protein